MTIPSHLRDLNDALTAVERVAEVAPERTFAMVRELAAAIDAASNGLRKALMERGLVALNDDRLRAVEATMFDYMLKGNPAAAHEVEVAKGFDEALDGPAGERVMAQMVRDRDFLDRTLGRERAASEDAAPAAAVDGIAASDEVLLLEQARYVLKNLHARHPDAGYGKLSLACGRAAERSRAAEPDDAPAPRM